MKENGLPPAAVFTSLISYALLSGNKGDIACEDPHPRLGELSPCLESVSLGFSRSCDGRFGAIFHRRTRSGSNGLHHEKKMQSKKNRPGIVARFQASTPLPPFSKNERKRNDPGRAESIRETSWNSSRGFEAEYPGYDERLMRKMKHGNLMEEYSMNLGNIMT